jgi:twitching motility protein PilI
MTTDPLSILKHIEDRCRLTATGLPQKTTTVRQWSGVAFRTGSTGLVAAMGEVVEILTYPELSVVPYTCPWVRGIANIRGRLLTVMDLNGYLHGRLASIGKRTRVMVAECRGVYSGLVVDEVMGLRHFPQEAFIAEPAGIEEALRPYVHQGFSMDGEQWGIFKLLSLVESPQFLHTAA